MVNFTPLPLLIFFSKGVDLVGSWCFRDLFGLVWPAGLHLPQHYKQFKVNYSLVLFHYHWWNFISSTKNNVTKILIELAINTLPKSRDLGIQCFNHIKFNLQLQNHTISSTFMTSFGEKNASCCTLSLRKPKQERPGQELLCNGGAGCLGKISVVTFMIVLRKLRVIRISPKWKRFQMNWVSHVDLRYCSHQLLRDLLPSDNYYSTPFSRYLPT